MKTPNKQHGFTLVELLVSVGITAILMVGISTFFSSTFQTMFAAREQVSNSQGQFVLNTILAGKMTGLQALVDEDSDHVLIQNRTDEGDLPFTYITEDSGRLVFRDFFIFSGRDGADSSSNSSIDNAGGMVKLGTNFYVAAPLENRIYICGPNNLNSCNILGLNGDYTDLDHPTDVTADPTNSMLYITDSGNGRIISVDLQNAQTTGLVASGLDFPAGIAFYTHNTSDYLFVSEPYDNKVLKIAASDGSTQTIVGLGQNEDCDNTASLCKLNFPTGLAVGNDGTGEALYIADTGNVRVLRVADPDIDKSDFELVARIAGPGNTDTRVSRVDFVFPDGSDLTGTTHGSTDDELHKGIYTAADLADNIASYRLTTTYDDNYLTFLGCPDFCVEVFQGFDFNDADDNIFDSSDVGDNIVVGNTQYTILSVPDDFNVRTVEQDANIPADPNAVSYWSEFSPGDYSFYLDLSAASIPGGFIQVGVQPYSELASLDLSVYTFRFGDGELGTSEDMVSVHSSGLNYPTGVSFDGSDLEISDSADYDESFSDYDYRSDFEVQNFAVSTMNGGNILELGFEARLKDDTAGNPVYEPYTFNASLAP